MFSASLYTVLTIFSRFVVQKIKYIENKLILQGVEEGVENVDDGLARSIAISKKTGIAIEEPHSKLRGMFCRAAVLRIETVRNLSNLDSLANPAASYGVSARCFGSKLTKTGLVTLINHVIQNDNLR